MQVSDVELTQLDCGLRMGAPRLSGRRAIAGLRDFWQGLRTTWTPSVCKITAFMAVLMGLGLLCYILLGPR